MRHLIMAVVMFVGALLVTATMAAYLQNRAISASQAGSYEPPSVAGPTSPSPKTRLSGGPGTKPEPAVIGVRGRSLITPRTSVAATVDAPA